MAVYSIIKKSELEGTRRLDAEYYQPEYLETRKLVSNMPNITLGEISSKFRKGIFDIKADTYVNEGVPFIRISNLRGGLINEAGIAFISSEASEKEKATLLRRGDLVLSKTAYPAASLITFSEVNISQDIIGISIKKEWKEKILPPFVVAFLNSKFGIAEMQQWFQGNIQMHLSLPDSKTILIPLLPIETQRIVSSLFEESETKTKNSANLYSQAENLLLEELGLKNFESKNELWSVVNLSEAKKVNRIDAEYFQPKYQKILSLVRANGGVALGELATIKKGFEPGSEAYQGEGKLFIRVSSISKDGITDKDQKYLKDELYQKLKKDYQPKVGEILLTKDASPGMAYVVKESIEGIISGGVLRVKLKEDIEPEYLALVVNSVIGQSQVERDAGGSIIMHWKPDQVKEFQVPILPKPTQQKIAELVRKSHEARKKAKELLGEARRRVESLIEETATCR